MPREEPLARERRANNDQVDFCPGAVPVREVDALAVFSVEIFNALRRIPAVMSREAIDAREPKGPGKQNQG